MKGKAVLLAISVVLAGCGGGQERPVPENDLEGVGGFLKRAFAERSASVSRAGGGLCGDPQILGEPAGAVTGSNPACGMSDAVRVTSVAGVALSQPALIRCETAVALRHWVETGAKPALETRKRKLTELKVAAHYACRTRNHQPGAKISEHGKGRAIDLSAFRMSDGSEITVLDDWGRGGNGKALRSMHRAACGPFGTVLGPGSDGFHEDHFHFDTARHRGGPYCR